MVGSRPPYAVRGQFVGLCPPHTVRRQTVGSRPPYEVRRQTVGLRPPYGVCRQTVGLRPPYGVCRQQGRVGEAQRNPPSGFWDRCGHNHSRQTGAKCVWKPGTLPMRFKAMCKSRSAPCFSNPRDWYAGPISLWKSRANPPNIGRFFRSAFSFSAIDKSHRGVVPCQPSEPRRLPENSASAF